MELRKIVLDTDIAHIQSWCTDERTHALWCAGRFRYPVEKESFSAVLGSISDTPFIAVENGRPIGFFCLSDIMVNGSVMLKFVIVDPTLRGKGVGRSMLRLACGYAFENTEASAVQLNVFSVNTTAIRCYKAAGFAEFAVTGNAFSFGEESWGRCSMILTRKDMESR